MYDVIATTRFSAAHRLKYLDGKYENLHGHNWTATVTVCAREVDDMGVGIDFVVLKRETESLISKLDYQTLNEVPPFDQKNPSAENIACWLYRALSLKLNTDRAWVKRVEIREMPDCGAVYYE